MTPLGRDLFGVIDLACSAVVIVATTAVGALQLRRHSRAWKLDLTCLSLVAGASAGLLLAWGKFGMAGVALALTPLAKVLGGRVRERTLSQRVVVASVEQYEELFALSGLAFFFRSSATLLALTLLACLGSFMITYGSAKGAARDVHVPASTMQRFERSVYLAAGVTLAAFVGNVGARFGGPPWSVEVPVVMAVAYLGIGANVSAVRRLRSIARAPTQPVARLPQPADAPVARASAH